MNPLEEVVPLHVKNHISSLKCVYITICFKTDLIFKANAQSSSIMGLGLKILHVLSSDSLSVDKLL